MKSRLHNIYVLSILVSLLAALYSLFIPGILKPNFSSEKMKQSLQLLDSHKLVSIKETKLDKDTSDRKVSRLYQYSYDDGSTILATVVRVRRRDDFKIETYGLLTKELREIYVENPRSTNSVPYSIFGLIDNRDSFQTCIVPRTTRPDQADIRLNPLANAVESLDTTPKNLLSKLVGTEKVHDYSCIVLTYQPPPSQPQTERSRIWLSIVRRVQSALVR